MGDINNKERILKVIEILQKYSDEENELSINDILSKLNFELGPDYNVDKKAVLDDIASMDRSGIPVIINKGSKNKNLYSIQNRIFEIHELRMLIDAVSSARFISRNETQKIIEKIKMLTSINMAKKLQNQVHYDENAKSEDNKIAYSLDKLHTAISEKKRVAFQYGNYNINKEFILHREGKLYNVTPLGLVWNSDYYYLVAIDDIHEHTVNYRVDRMRNVQTLNDVSREKYFDIEEHVKNSFNMYSGDVESVEIEFDNHLINVVIDRFGTKIDIKKYSESTFVIRIKAAITKGLVRWILTWGKDARVISPESLVNELKEESESMFKIYKG